MPLLCMKCDTRVEGNISKPGTFWCSGCEKELGKDDVYRVGKRFFASGIGMMMAMAAAMSQSLPKGIGDFPSVPTKRSKEAANTLAIAQRQKRKKIYGLKKKQRRHDRQMRRR